MRPDHNYIIQCSYFSIASWPGLSVSFFQAKTSLFKDSISCLKSERRSEISRLSPGALQYIPQQKSASYAACFAASYALNIIKITARFMQFNILKLTFLGDTHTRLCETSLPDSQLSLWSPCCKQWVENQHRRGTRS